MCSLLKHGVYNTVMIYWFGQYFMNNAIDIGGNILS